MTFTSERAAPPAPRHLIEIGRRAAGRVASVLADEAARWGTVDPELEAPIRHLAALVAAGGKRLRPAFCHWAFVGAGGDPHDPGALDAGAALELLHAFALVHDDVMDGSDLRRGQPAAHRAFAARHRTDGWHGEARRFGEGVAILIGDLAHVYADRLVAGAPRMARDLFDELRVELNVGQYLDLLGTARHGVDHAGARRIARYKSGKYTVERPLHLGAALAGRYDELHAPLSAVGMPLGEAFQLRDDLLGAFGDESALGKPVGGDLREGKPTPLLALAVERADPGQARLLQRVGDADLTDADVVAIREVLEATGARGLVEAAIEQLATEAIGAIRTTPLTPAAAAALTDLARYVAWRDR